MADCYRGMNQQFKSIEYWNRILELDPNNKVILTRAGDAFRTTGNFEKAVEIILVKEDRVDKERNGNF